MRRHLWSIGLILGAVLLVYSNALQNGFVWDDHIYIEGNPFVQDPANLKLLVRPDYYLGANDVLLASRPVFLASLLLDRALWGARPGGYHAVSVALHAANSLLLFAVSLALGLAPGAGLGAALFFGLHPVQTEAVDAVSFRPDLLAAFFVLAGLWVYLQARGRKMAQALALVAASAALFALGLLSKESAAALPALILLAEVYLPSAPGRGPRAAAALASFFLVASAFAGFWSARFRYSGIGAPSPARAAVDRYASAMPTAPGPARLDVGVEKGHILPPTSSEWEGLYVDPRAHALTMIKALAGYFRLLVLPSPLVADRAPAVVRSWGEGGVLWCLASLIALMICAVAGVRKRPVAAFGLAWCLAALLPVSGIIPLYNPVAERYLYLVTAGAAVAAAGLAGRRGALIAGVILLAYGVKTHRRNRDWKDERSLFLDSSGKAPQSSRASFIRASLLQSLGQAREAAEQYEQAVGANPGFTEAWLGLGEAYSAQGDLTRADACYRRALPLEPRNAVLRFAYGLFLTRIKQPVRAIDAYKEAIAIEKRYVEAWVNLGSLYRDSGRYEEAKKAYTSAVAYAAPHDPIPYYSFAVLMEKTGDLQDAAKLYKAALDRDASFKSAHLKLGKLYARLGRKKESSEELNRALAD